jgi:hypothetical protein
MNIKYVLKECELCVKNFTMSYIRLTFTEAMNVPELKTEPQ